MRHLALAAAVGVVVCVPGRAHADDVVVATRDTSIVDDGCIEMSKRWPAVPDDTTPSFDDQLTDHLSAFGDFVGAGLTDMTGQTLTLHVDGRHNSARIGIGHGGAGHYLTFKLDSNWLFSHGQAHVDARIELGLGTHHIELQLPEMDIIPDNWHGQDLVVVDFNLLQRRF